MYVFFDTETNGKPKRYGAPVEDLDNWPRVAQLAYAVYNDKEEMIDSFNSHILPDGWTIPNEKFFIDNNMSTERCQKEGIPIAVALDKYIQVRTQYPIAVAHNYSFDGIIMRAEMIRANKVVEFNSKKCCTMKASTKFCNLPGPRGPKWPKLEELYRILFNKDFDGAHDAMADLQATAECFFELKRRGVITID